jgi:hypothetical protein
VNGHRKKLTSGGAGSGSAGSPRARKRRERRKREKREEDERPALQFKFGPIVPIRLARLSRATCSGATGGHMSQGGWAISYVTAVSATQSHQTPWSD